MLTSGLQNRNSVLSSRQRRAWVPPARSARRAPAMSALLLPLQLESVPDRLALLDYGVQAATGRLYVYLTGEAASQPPTRRTLDLITLCFEPVARLKPRLDLVPLLPCAGWTLQRLAALPDLQEVVAAAEEAEEGTQLLGALNTARQAAELPPLALTLTSGRTQQQQPQEQQQRGPVPTSRVLGSSEEGPLQFARVAVGGTFDRLHAGHRLLLAAVALMATDHIFVGVTAEKLLERKNNRQLLQPYGAREASAVEYMRAVNPRAQVYAGPLEDPKVPPVAATDPAFDGIVVSEETIPGADAINGVRRDLGFEPLTVVVVGLLAAHSTAPKLSSTDLRALEAQGL